MRKMEPIENLRVGLTAQQVEESRRQHGGNGLTPPKQEPIWRKFLEKFTDPIIIILLITMLLSFGVSIYSYVALGEGPSVFLEPVGVMVAVLLATGVAFYFELKSAKEFSILNQVNEAVHYRAWRDGMLHQVLKNDLVVGDVIELETGEQIPADGVLLEAVSLQVDESSLTGEPMASKTVDETLFDKSATYPSNRILRGTTVLDGHCLYRVDRVGDATEYGKVYEGAQIDDSVKTPLNAQLDRLADLIAKVSYGIAGLVLVGSVIMYAIDGHFSPFEWEHALSYFLGKIMVAVTVVVVAVPEGLPMSVTLSLAYSMRSMMQSNNLVRRMHACETMGAATVICTDKTGTLTQNRMSVVATLFEPEYAKSTGGVHPLVAEAMAVNSTAHLEVDEKGTVQPVGNPTEGGLLLWLREAGTDYLRLREKMPPVEQLTFSTERKYMATVVESVALGRRVVYVKGAPEIVLGTCTLTAERRAQYDEQLTDYQNRAMRTLALAYGEVSGGGAAFANGGLTITSLRPIGVVAIADPIRPEVPDAVRACQQAGIQVKVVTGDTPGTAKEIGRQIGLWDDTCGDGQLITGEAFAAQSDEQLLPQVQGIRIMARARPMDKERLVRLLQAKGEVVAVTGDGTNDAPALNRAHVGLSMGDGTAVAKEASDITIIDNSFASIGKAVMWGRSLYQNIQRFILFQMTINVAACLIVLVGAFTGAESPLTVTQMLWVNLIMDTFAALALASLPPSERVMRNKPRRPGEYIITRAMANRIFAVGGFFVVLLFAIIQYFKHYDVASLLAVNFADVGRAFINFRVEEEMLTPYELTVFFTLFVFLQFWNMFNAKAFQTGRSAFAGLTRCRNFLLIALVIVVGQWVIVTVGGEMFRVIPLDALTWAIIIGVTSLVLWGGELGRAFSQKNR